MDVPSELKEWPGHIGNWGRWPNDRGTLNLITQDVTARGVASSKTGQVISCARETLEEDPIYGWPGVKNEMTFVGMPYPSGNLQTALDAVTIHPHGMFNTHIDAFAHVGYKGYTFNGRRFDDVVDQENGAKLQDSRDLLGIVTRGVFVDVARARGVKGLEPGDFVRPEEIEAAVALTQPGDALIIRTGVSQIPGIPPKEGEERHGKIGGLHYECVNLLGRSGVSVLASDSPSDVFPSPIAEICESPVHRLSLVFWGIPLVHNMDLEALGEACAAQNRNDFLFVVSALNIPKTTGCLCTPVAVL
ncbi:MAG: cyclase family protein [Hoeflea sp.]|uniref:cyclase family protein n=1 Tax=Hoeflea sp. TaxID=1940281 RepID=UPI00329692F0